MFSRTGTLTLQVHPFIIISCEGPKCVSLSSRHAHILTTVQVFYFIRPTPANLAAYERWSGTDIQNHSWLGDMVDEVLKVDLHAGNTMVIPTGWIHAVVGSTNLLPLFLSDGVSVG
jgi:hypothetical protein